MQWGEVESDYGTANMVWDYRHVAAYSKHHKMQLILLTDVLLFMWFFLSEQWKLWLILEVTDRWWILYSIVGSNSNIKAMVVGHILLQLGSSAERKVIFTATAGPYPHWGVFGNDSLDQVFPCMSVQPCFSFSCTPGVTHCHPFLPQCCVLFRAHSVEGWESQARQCCCGSGCSPLAKLSFC